MCCGFPYSVRYLAEPLMGPFARRGNKIAVRHEQNISAFVAPGDFIDPAVLAEIFFRLSRAAGETALLPPHGALQTPCHRIFRGTRLSDILSFSSAVRRFRYPPARCIYRLFAYRLGFFRGERGSYKQYAYEYDRDCEHGERYIKSYIVHHSFFCPSFYHIRAVRAT